MLSQERIPIGKLKQAYELSEHDINALMAKLLPSNVFPYALWQNAYTEFWHWSIREHAQRYRLQEPSFPDAGALPEKYFPTSLHRILIVRFFDEISKSIEISALEKGFDYIIDAAYGENNFPYKEQKESLFSSLRQEERSLANFQRTSGHLIIDSIQAVDHFCISESFFDTIVVDKYAALSHIILSGYSFRGPVKGISSALVEHITAKVFAVKNNDDVHLEPVDPSQELEQHAENFCDSFPPQSTLETTPEQESAFTTSTPTVLMDIAIEDAVVTPPVLISVDATPSGSSLELPEASLENNPSPASKIQPLPPFHFNRELLNKTPEAVYEILHAEKVHPRVIARVLYSRCGITTHLQLSVILGTYSRKIKTYLTETESMMIIDL